MPILSDIRDHPILGREFKRAEQHGIKQGLEKGIQKGIEQGIERGIEQGERALLRKQIEKRFGSIPAHTEERLANASSRELEILGVRLLDASSLDDLLRPV